MARQTAIQSWCAVVWGWVGEYVVHPGPLNSHSYKGYLVLHGSDVVADLIVEGVVAECLRDRIKT